jgi:nickel superoxide dismutase
VLYFSLMIQFLLRFLPVKIIYAHCDIPCGIYDPHNMQMAAHTVIRMTQMIQELEDGEDHKKFTHQMARLVKVKEEHGELCKHELRVLWADYFKPEHLEKYPDLHILVFETMKLASKGRQGIDMESSQKLLENTQKIAGIFFETKGLKSKKVKAPYPTEKEIVVQD